MFLGAGWPWGKPSWRIGFVKIEMDIRASRIGFPLQRSETGRILSGEAEAQQAVTIPR